MSLYPKKSVLGVFKGKLLGHVFAKDGVSINPERVQAIQQIALPRNQKSNSIISLTDTLLHRFDPNFTENTKPISDMLKKDRDICWTGETRHIFAAIKWSLCDAPILVSPESAKEFQFFSFSTDFAFVVILLHKNHEGYDSDKP